jgi:hypothetical protein
LASCENLFVRRPALAECNLRQHDISTKKIFTTALISTISILENTYVVEIDICLVKGRE